MTPLSPGPGKLNVIDAGMGHLERSTLNADDTKLLKGLPQMTDEEKDRGESRSRKMVMMAPLIPTAVGVAIAVPIHMLSAPASLGAKVAIASQYELTYLLLAVFVVTKVVLWANFYPMIFKSRVMRGNSGNLRANMSIYRVIDDGATVGDEVKHVVLDDDGDIGAYNRANRSLTHLTENLAAFVLPMIFAGAFYPQHALALSLVWALGRVLHATGYTTKYGAHGLGFGLALLSCAVAEGLLLVAAYTAFVAK